MFSAHIKTAFRCCWDPLIYCEVPDVIPQTPTSDTKKSTWPSVDYRWKRWHSQARHVHADAQSLRHLAPVTAGHIWLMRSIPPSSHYIFTPENIFSAGVNDQARNESVRQCKSNELRNYTDWYYMNRIIQDFSASLIIHVLPEEWPCSYLPDLTSSIMKNKRFREAASCVTGTKKSPLKKKKSHTLCWNLCLYVEFGCAE